MKSYTPSYAGVDIHVRREFQAIAQAAARAEDLLELKVLYAEPSRVRAGMVVYADGVTWNPDGVSGEGLYRRNKTNASWVFVG